MLGLCGFDVKETGTCERSCLDGAGASGQEAGLLSTDRGPHVGFAQPSLQPHKGA